MKSSIITKLTITVITYFLILFTIFTGYTAYKSWKTSTATLEETMEKNTQYTASQIEKTFQQAFEMLDTEASAIATHYKNNTLTDEFIVDLKRALLQENNHLRGNSSVFEPPIVSVISEAKKQLIDDSKRFVPYVVPDEGNNIIGVPIESYLQEDWYVETVTNVKEIVTEPYDYQIDCKTVSIDTLAKLVIIDGKSIGYVLTDFTLDFLTNTVKENAPEGGVLRVVTAHNLVFTRNQIYERVLGEHMYGEEKTVTIHIAKLRKEIGDDSKNPKVLENLRGIGYKSVPPVGDSI